MALTQEQWYAKIKSWLPAWFFEQESLNRAVLEAAAMVFLTAQQNAEDHLTQTFIQQATNPFLDAHGDERNLTRLPNENDGAFSARIANIINNSNKPALLRLVQGIVVRGSVDIREQQVDRIFASRGSYCSRHEIFESAYYNLFTVVVDRQVHLPYSFCSRGNFAGRLNYIGTSDDLPSIFPQIAAAVNKAKAFGVLCRIVETFR